MWRGHPSAARATSRLASQVRQCQTRAESDVAFAVLGPQGQFLEGCGQAHTALGALLAKVPVEGPPAFAQLNQVATPAFVTPLQRWMKGQPNIHQIADAEEHVLHSEIAGLWLRRLPIGPKTDGNSADSAATGGDKPTSSTNAAAAAASVDDGSTWTARPGQPTPTTSMQRESDDRMLRLPERLKYLDSADDRDVEVPSTPMPLHEALKDRREATNEELLALLHRYEVAVQVDLFVASPPERFLDSNDIKFITDRVVDGATEAEKLSMARLLVISNTVGFFRKVDWLIQRVSRGGMELHAVSVPIRTFGLPSNFLALPPMVKKRFSFVLNSNLEWVIEGVELEGDFLPFTRGDGRVYPWEDPTEVEDALHGDDDEAHQDANFVKVTAKKKQPKKEEPTGERSTTTETTKRKDEDDKGGKK